MIDRLNLIDNNELDTFYSHIQACKDCELGELDVNKLDLEKGFGKIYGYGKTKSILFVAQNPAFKRHGFFCFKNVDYGAGKFFNEMLKEVDINREDVFCTNLVKCSTKNDVKPGEHSVRACEKIFLAELKIIKPKIIVAVGELARNYFRAEHLKPNTWNNYTATAIFHPSFVLRSSISKDSYLKQLLFVKELKTKIENMSLNKFVVTKHLRPMSE